jgi:hypothetical protein
MPKTLVDQVQEIDFDLGLKDQLDALPDQLVADIIDTPDHDALMLVTVRICLNCKSGVVPSIQLGGPDGTETWLMALIADAYRCMPTLLVMARCHRKGLIAVTWPKSVAAIVTDPSFRRFVREAM